MESPRYKASVVNDMKAGSVKLGQDVLNPEFQKSFKRTTTALNAMVAERANILQTQRFDFGRKAPTNGFIRKSEVLRRPDMVSQDTMTKRRKQQYNNQILKAVTVEDKYKILQNIKKGSNDLGGTFGGKAPDREPSPNMPFKEIRAINQKYHPRHQRFNHSQVDPIIIRGAQNVDVNHLVYRKKEFK